MRYFSETQRFNQWWLKLLMISVLLVAGGSIFLAYPETAADELHVFTLVSTGALIVVLLVLWLVFSSKLITKVDEQGIHYQFYPFHRSDKIIPWKDMQSCNVRTYRPISEYGGWGYKVGISKKSGAFNVRGTIGIQIHFKSGKKLLLGTQKETAAKQVIAYYLEAIKSYE